jgi:hypothetical protein
VSEYIFLLSIIDVVDRDFSIRGAGISAEEICGPDFWPEPKS